MTAETYRGAPCAHGHTLRYRSNRKCVTCACAPARYFALSPGAHTAELVTIVETVYARRPGWTYWRATEIIPKH